MGKIYYTLVLMGKIYYTLVLIGKIYYTLVLIVLFLYYYNKAASFTTISSSSLHRLSLGCRLGSQGSPLATEPILDPGQPIPRALVTL